MKTLIQNTLKFLGESVESESILVEEKSKEIYDFLNQYLHTMDFDSYINNKTLYNVVIRNNQEIIGARIYKLDNGKLHLNYSAVKPEFRNKGLNQKMLNVIEKLAKENNVKTLTSNVRVSNTPSIKSLENSGFSINKNYPDLKYPDGEQKLPMFKHLTESSDLITGETVWNMIEDITTDKKMIPHSYKKLVVSRQFKHIEKYPVENILNNCTDFAEYYNHLLTDEDPVELNSENFSEDNHPIVIVDNELLDGYHRTAQKLLNNEEFINIYISV